MELIPVEYLRGGYTLADLEQRYAIHHRRHKRHPNLVQLKYDQIDSPMSAQIVQQCRGLILDEADNWRPACVPYFKFFNYGEGHAAPIDWSTARVQEKLDGSLMCLYWYKGSWEVASSGLPDASGPTGFGFTFAELFWRTWKELGYLLPDPTDWGEYTFMFEMMTPHNRVIVPHAKPRIVLHGVRDIDTLREYPPDWNASQFGWECVKSFPLNSLEAVVAACQALNPVECEGYVVVDHAFNRVKVKSPQYVALAHMKDGMSNRRMLDLVRTNEGSEFLAHFPEYRPLYEEIRVKFDGLVAELETVYAKAAGIDDQKTFAIQVCKTRLSGALFSLRKGQCKSVREYLAGATVQSLERALGVKAEAPCRPARADVSVPACP
jgi:hypothetical protein